MRQPTPTPATGTTPGADPLDATVDHVATILADTDTLEGLDTQQLRARMAQLARLAGLVEVATATTITALDAAGGVAADGAPSVAGWLTANHGRRSGRDASRLARLAATLPELPATAAALADGALSAEAADALVRAARDGRLGDPQVIETDLLPVATRETPERLRREIRHRLQQADPAALVTDERRQRARRRVSLSDQPDGMVALSALLPTEAGNRARTLLDVFDTPDGPDTPPQLRRSTGQRLADAFDAAVRVALDHAELDGTGGVARPHVSVIVDIATLDADLSDPHDPDRPVPTDDPAWADLPAGDTTWAGPLSPQAVRRICCDANISRIVTAGPSQVLDVGRATRTWSPAQRRAVVARDGRCRGPGCTRPEPWCHVHHLRWWRHGGETSVANGLLLCHHCHQLVHDRDWHVQLDPATAVATWTSPDRRRTVRSHPRRHTG